MNSRKHAYLILFSIALCVLLFCIDLGVGSINIPIKRVFAVLIGGDCPEEERIVIIKLRLIKGIVAVLAGAALSVSGLQMQTLFRNPLAGPYVLGISSGASLGVALFILASPLFTLPSEFMQLGIAGSAWIGAACVLALIGILGQRIKDIMVILILGMMFSSGIGAIVQILQYLSSDESLKSFIVWTMGSLGEITYSQLWVLLPSVVVGLIIAVLVIKPLNLLLFGEEYASTMGLDLKNSRNLIFLSTALLAGSVTAFCGPIGFIGLALPHVVRMIMKSSDHRILIPANITFGAATMLLCDIVSKLFLLPINAITSLIGIPIVILVVVKNSRR